MNQLGNFDHSGERRFKYFADTFSSSPAGTYYYVDMAVDGNSNESGYSNQAQAADSTP
ncbi:MAG: hypothetical protein ABSF85_06015 [Terriglobales bacterium]|jgi:hypothetical protein